MSDDAAAQPTGLDGLVEYIAKALVDAPDDVKVEEEVQEGTSVIKLEVVQEDLGKVIGKKGRTAKAMRTVLACAAARFERKTSLEIVE